MSEVKKASASLYISIDVECPYCEYSNNLTYEGGSEHEAMEAAFYDSSFGCEDCNIYVTCAKCKEEFVVTDIQY